MFDLIDEEILAEALLEECNYILDERYVSDLCKGLLPRLRETFDQAFETTFTILDRKTGKPMNVNALLTKRDSAEDFLKIVGDDKYEIGILLRDR